MMTGLSHLFQDFSHLPIDATLTIGHLKIMDAVKQQHDDFVRQCNCALLFLSAPAHDALNAAKLSLLGVLNHYHRKTEGDIASKLHLYNETIIRFIGCIKTDLDL